MTSGIRARQPSSTARCRAVRVLRARGPQNSFDGNSDPAFSTTSFRFDNEIERVTTANVFGVLPGRGPEHSDEDVVVSAHHDHLGVGKPHAHGDAVYNGALDNGAGVAQVLGIAKALAADPNPPRRSILVLFPAAEERGCWAHNPSQSICG